MELTLTTPAILFPAVSLLLLAYTNRFLALANIVRVLINSATSGNLDMNRQRQIASLNLRIRLIRWMQASGVSCLILCVISIITLYAQLVTIGSGLFMASLVLMLVSLAFSLWEILLSGQALQLELERYKTGCKKGED